MGVYGALLTGVTGLSGQSTKMGAISDNIANVNTVGYKKADVPFQSLVTDPFGRATSYSPGGVLSKPRQLISQQGVITGTASSTDMAISGRGFFIVSEETDAGLDNSRFYTRAGSFRTAIDPNDPQKSLLQNTGGFYLTGIPVTDRNDLPQPNTLVGLETVNVNRIINTARATENVKTQANLAAEAEQNGGSLTVFNADGTQKAFTGATGAAPVPGSVNVNAAGPFSVILADGTTRNISMNELFGLPASGAGSTISPTQLAITAGQGVRLDSDLTIEVDRDGTGVGVPITVTQAQLEAQGFVNGGTVEQFAQALNGVASISGTNTVTFNASQVGTNLEVFALVNNGTTTVARSIIGDGLIDAAANVNSAAQTFVDFGAPNSATPGQVTATATVPIGNQIHVPASGLSFSVDGQTVTISLATLRAGGYDPNIALQSDPADLAAAIAAAPNVTVNGTTYNFTGTNHDGVNTLTLQINNVTSPLATVTLSETTIDNQIVDSALFLPTGETAGAAAAITNTSLDRLINRFNQFSLDLNNDSLVDVDFNASVDANGFLNFSAFQDGKALRLNLQNFNIDDATASATTTISGSQGDWATLFQSDLTQTQLIYDALGAPHNVQLQYVKRPDESNLWEVNLSDGNVSGFLGNYDPTSNDGNGARFVVRDEGGQVVETQRLFLKFNGDGSLNSVRTTVNGENGTAFGQRGGGSTTGVVANRETDVASDPKLISIAIGPVTVGATGEAVATPIRPIPNGAQVFGGDDGTPTTAEAVVYEWNVGRPTNLTGSAAGTGLDGLTQFDSGEVTPQIETNFYSQDGARLGNISGVTVDDNGTLFALFDNGLVEPIYVLPVATFNNPDGLINYTGNIFAESGESGQVQVKRAGDQGAGDIVGSAVENSNVDLGDEFTNMIITQQSFTANTRTITTADRMLEELVRILR